MIFRKLLYVCFILLVGFGGIQAQSLRSLNNEGVNKYKDKKYTDAEVNFKKNLDKAPDNFITNFNLGDAYYQQKRYDEALQSYQTALAEAKTKNDKARVYHNIGNSLLKSNQIKESIDAYKNSLKINPDDNDTRYNLSYALSMLKNQQNQQKQNQNQQNKNQDQKNNQNQNNNQNQKNKDQQKQNQNQQNQTAQNDATKQKQQQNKISKEEAERILQALRNNEKELQKQLRRQKGTPLKIEKDW